MKLAYLAASLPSLSLLSVTSATRKTTVSLNPKVITDTVIKRPNPVTVLKTVTQQEVGVDPGAPTVDVIKQTRATQIQVLTTTITVHVQPTEAPAPPPPPPPPPVRYERWCGLDNKYVYVYDFEMPSVDNFSRCQVNPNPDKYPLCPIGCYPKGRGGQHWTPELARLGVWELDLTCDRWVDENWFQWQWCH